MFLYFALLIEYFHIVYIQKKKYPFFDAATSLFSKFTRRVFMMTILFLGYMDISYFLYANRFFDLPKLGIPHYIAIFILIDLAYYWIHRAGHQLRIFWIPHSVHHTPEQIMIIRSTQQSISGQFLSPLFIATIPMCLCGVSPQVFWTLYFLNSSYQELLHNEFIPRLGILEYVFNTPAQHRIHHSVRIEHIDKNFGGVFSIWDQLFGTFHLDNSKVEIYGTTPFLENKSIFTPMIYEYNEFKKLGQDLIRAPGMANKISVFFQSPQDLQPTNGSSLMPANKDLVAVGPS